MPENLNIIRCMHCARTWDKTQLPKSCSNCFGCTGCEAYICPECRYEIVLVPPKPMKRSNREE